ncbi:MAG: ArsR family transcriptional regulator [Promethearchaeota archaeon]
MKEISISEIGPFIKALHCPTRWKIIEFLETGSKSSDEINEYLIQNDLKLNMPALYYHLRELEAVEIIKLEEYIPSDQNRAPKKIWKLNLKQLNIKLMK